MQDADLFIELAGIAGVFVGFGALIAVRSGGASEPREVVSIRSMVSFGMLTVVAALAPVTFGRFDLAEHGVWALRSAVFLGGLSVVLVAVYRTPEYRATWAAELALTAGRIEGTRTSSRWIAVLQEGVANGLFMMAVVLIPIVIVAGVAPELEAALYFALVVLNLLGAAWLLLWLVFAQRGPATA